MSTPFAKFEAAMSRLPLVAILRGLAPADAPAIGDVLVEAGFRLLEVPLNSPRPLEGIALLRQRFPQALVGAGTVLRAAEVRDVASAGGELIVAPNTDREVIAETVRLGLVSIPGGRLRPRFFVVSPRRRRARGAPQGSGLGRRLGGQGIGRSGTISA